MISDLGKHPELERSADVAVMLMLTADLHNPDSVRKFIEGFN